MFCPLDLQNGITIKSDFNGLICISGRFFICNRTAAAKSLQSCPTLCDPIDGSPPGSPILGILQARTLEWVAISFSNAWKWSEREVAQSCPTLCDPMDCSPPGSSVHGTFQARVLEWVAIAFSIVIEQRMQYKEPRALMWGDGVSKVKHSVEIYKIKEKELYTWN